MAAMLAFVGTLRFLQLASASSPASPIGTLSCTNATSTSLTLRWAGVDSTDLYQVSLAGSPTRRPAALQTTAEPSMVFDDLYPDRVQGLGHHLGPFPTNSLAVYHPSCGVRRDLLGGHAYELLIGACDPMAWPIHAFRTTG